VKGLPINETVDSVTNTLYPDTCMLLITAHMTMMQFYGSRPLLAVMVAPLLRHITQRLRSKHTTAVDDTTTSSSATTFSASTAAETARQSGMDILVLSGHDVTVAALLYALQSHVTLSPGYWPAYSR
jgi:polysaccharide deacetylase 2 family uncharacterized protein YibQ